MFSRKTRLSSTLGPYILPRMISTSEIRISVVTRSSDAPKAVEAIHTAFELDSENEAVVYAGTGR